MRELSRRHRRRHHRRRRRRHGHSRNYTSTANETSLATLPSDRHFVAMAADTAGTGRGGGPDSDSDRAREQEEEVEVALQQATATASSSASPSWWWTKSRTAAFLRFRCELCYAGWPGAGGGDQGLRVSCSRVWFYNCSRLHPATSPRHVGGRTSRGSGDVSISWSTFAIIAGNRDANGAHKACYDCHQPPPASQSCRQSSQSSPTDRRRGRVMKHNLIVATYNQ